MSSSSVANQDQHQCFPYRSIFLVNNVHCASCISYVEEVVSQASASPSDVGNIDCSILTHEVRVDHRGIHEASSLASALVEAAFEVHHVTTYDVEGRVVSELDTSSWHLSKPFLHFPDASSRSEVSTLNNGRANLHVANCDMCRKEELERVYSAENKSQDKGQNRIHITSHERPRESSDEQPLVSSPHSPNLSRSDRSEEFRAQVSIGGMTCASCANSITSAVKELEFVEDITVNILTNSAVVSYVGKESDINSIVERIEDIGFEASPGQVTATSSPKKEKNSDAYIVELSIGGMTCGSCVGTVTRGIEELPFVTNVSVNLLTHSGRVNFNHRDNVDTIVSKIEDLGYDASIASLHSLATDDEENTGSTTEEMRTVSIHVDGMFCHHCPDKVLEALHQLSDSSVITIEKAPSVRDPIMKVTYMPRPPAITIRSVLFAIDSAHEAFKSSVYHPPSIEDRSRAMQLRERRRLLTRLLFVFAVTIATFLIGIVFMNLVSSKNRVRMFLERPIWAGNVTRFEWALFIMSTPVMFYGTDVFHRRAAKEIYALWRPGSRVPIFRRFYRFGSMNLLISAGTLVAYVASLAVLIMDSVASTKSSSHSTTYFDSVVFLTFFILAGRFVEAYSKAKTGDAVTSLGKLRPSQALLVCSSSSSNSSISGRIDRQNEGDWRRADSITKQIAVDLLERGDVVRILHGVSPPTDGIVISDDGSFQFDESSLTGESRPVKKVAGDQVYAGSINVGEPLQVRVTEVGDSSGGSSMLDKIISVVREGQTRRAPMERFADMITAHFVPAITFIAVSTFVIWLSLGESGVLPKDYLDVSRGGWVFWSLQFAISVFVVACPCGLALAAPTAMFVGAGLAARRGILVKGGGEAFQEASRLDAIVFDKTGTLTEGGNLKVSDHETLSMGWSDDEMRIAWALARELEEGSNHPVAKAIAEACAGKGGDGDNKMSVTASKMHEIPGQGMKGMFSVSLGDRMDVVEYEAAIGNERLFKGLSSPDADTYYLSSLLSKYQSAGKSTAILSLRQVRPKIDDDGASPYFRPAIVFAASDSIRPESVHVISQLQSRKVDVFMCSGDNQDTASAVADMLGIPRSNVMANVLPNEKAEFIHQIQGHSSSVDSDNTRQQEDHISKRRNTSRPIVAFVGDGVNDSPALAAADVSIAMASGSDVAVNSAGFILLNSDLGTILELVLLSRRVFNRVRMNFVWAMIYNMCLVPVSAGVFYPIVSGHRQLKPVTGGQVITINEHWRLSPVWAALAMALSSISVVSSSLALRVDFGRLKKVVLG